MTTKPLIVITGASSGIGEATALKYSQEGYPLLLLARRLERLQALNLPNTLCEKVDVTTGIKSVCSFDDATIESLTGCDPDIIRKLAVFSDDELAELTFCDPYKKTKKSPNELEKEGVSPKIIDVLTTTRINGMKTVKHNPKPLQRLFKNV